MRDKVAEILRVSDTNFRGFEKKICEIEQIQKRERKEREINNNFDLSRSKNQTDRLLKLNKSKKLNFIKNH